MDSEENTPIERPRTREAEQNAERRRMVRTIIMAVGAILLPIATMYIQRHSDLADGDSKAKAVEQKVDNAKEAADKAIATVSNAAQSVAQLAVETHEDVAATAGSKRKPRPTDSKLLQKVQAGIRDLKKVEAKAAPLDSGTKPDAGADGGR